MSRADADTQSGDCPHGNQHVAWWFGCSDTGVMGKKDGI